MNILNLDFKDSIPSIIDVYVEVYGEKYRNIITERAKKIVYICYNNLFGIKEYYEDLLQKEGKRIIEYETYISYEEKRKKKINNSKKYQIYLNIEGELSTLKNNLRSKNFNDLEIINALLSSQYGIELGFNIEYFSEENDKTLNDVNTSKIERDSILEGREAYFKSVKATTEEDKKIMTPSYELVKLIKKNRKEQLKKAQNEFIFSEKSISKLVNINIDQIIDFIKNNMVCTTGGSNKECSYFPIIFYTITYGSAGKLDYMFLHEFCHAIESLEKNNEKTSGFDILESTNLECNPYCPNKRKYEIMNETFTDILALEAREKLHSKNIYFAEPKNLCDNDLEDINSSVIIKRILEPFLTEYRDEIMETRISGNIEGFASYIGFQNYESLNDSINKIDYLIDQGLCEEMSDNNLGKLFNLYSDEIFKIREIYNELGINDTINKAKNEKNF